MDFPILEIPHVGAILVDKLALPFVLSSCISWSFIDSLAFCNLRCIRGIKVLVGVKNLWGFLGIGQGGCQFLQVAILSEHLLKDLASLIYKLKDWFVLHDLKSPKG